MRPYLEKTQHKNRTGGVVHVVKCLPSKCEALSSNPVSPPQKKEKEM
jgi:hypothetical protein